ncbi:Verru_Chthon cassette protein A [Chthoniobacter flavus]|uniref:Verru_Chthon cassette protein A n=1 Tax=Chthoniobacter flavus TaxID=191863 RepID=UPI00192CA685|nr:Verru_Chthon cassette protein A [Chthoniobacter flavus]
MNSNAAASSRSHFPLRSAGGGRVDSGAKSRQQGVALVIVLFVLVLITTLIVGFLTLVSTERQASSSYADDSSTRMLADSAVNVVIAQIRQATDTLNDDPASPKTWASQPGMIRVYGSDGGTGSGGSGLASLQKAYKLYSSDQMSVSAFGASEENAEIPPANWSATPPLYTDLNEPVKVADPANPGSTKLRYPILDPGVLTNVPGMQIQNAPGTTSTQSAPMPVKWLYVLKDGTTAAAQAVPGSPTQVDVTGATAANPIVGRIAFWTDDECAKVNINTASEGVFWDTPKANTTTERSLASSLPVKNEFQRYPGHPSTVCLSPVLGNYLPNTAGSTAAGTSKYGLYYDLAPRVQTGGSLDGTRPITSSSANLVIKPDSDRLYATPDEYLFKATSMTSGQRDVNTSELTADMLAQTQFLLTAQSRAPEVTLFNTPRVCLWPIQQYQTTYTTQPRNAYDQLIGFCSSLGSDPSLPAGYPFSRGFAYYFQRGYVTALLAKQYANSQATCYSATADYAKIPRNQALYAYLQRLTSQSIPGFGGNFLGKYPNDRDQILTECYDYIRSLVNTVPTPRQNLTPYYSYGPYYVDFGIISPIQIGTTMGQGRFYTIAQAALLFYPTQVDVSPTNPTVVTTRTMRARLIIQPYCISPGASAFNQNFQIKVSGMNSFMADSTNLGLNANGVNATRTLNFAEGYYSADTFSPANKTALPSMGGQFFASNTGGKSPLLVPGQGSNGFDIWASNTDINVVGKPTFQFNGGNITVTVIGPDHATQIQTFTINFPAQTLPVPARVGGLNDIGKQLVTGVPNRYQLDYYNRFFYSLKNQNTTDPLYGRYEKNAQSLLNNLIYPGDTVYAMAVDPAGTSAGDMRIIAYQPSITSGYFKAQSNLAGMTLRGGVWTNSGQFRSSWTTNFKNSQTSGTLIPGLTYPEDAIPMVPPGLSGALNQYGAPGDWDTGDDIQEDGPYVNKADEGSTSLGYFTRGSALGYVAAGGESGGYGSQGSETDNITFSPNREIASAVMFGSLPTGVHGKSNKPEPWQTLLFNPQPAAGTQHYGLTFPQDHLWLDLFWMPIVEPYAISEPFSTAGKVNMNYDIVPFRYLKRRTALQGVLKGVSMTAIPDSDVTIYKKQPWNGATNAANSNYRLAIDPDPAGGTLKGFEDRFKQGDIFHSATEICGISLVPLNSGATYDNMSTWWQSHRLTGDNLRESPYNQLYPRLTTKSNTYTVHVRVQSLRKNAANGTPERWDEARDNVVGEYRGSCLIERYVDATETDLPDFTSTADTNGNGIPDNQETLDHYYKFRIIQRRQFAP